MTEANGTALLADGEVFSAPNLSNLPDFIRTSIHHKYSPAIKFTTHMLHVCG